MSDLAEKRTCRDYAALISSAEFRKLSAVEQTAIRVHLAKCDACKVWDQQVAFMRSAIGRWRG